MKDDLAEWEIICSICKRVVDKKFSKDGICAYCIPHCRTMCDVLEYSKNGSNGIEYDSGHYYLTVGGVVGEWEAKRFAEILYCPFCRKDLVIINKKGEVK